MVNDSIWERSVVKRGTFGGTGREVSENEVSWYPPASSVPHAARFPPCLRYNYRVVIPMMGHKGGLYTFTRAQCQMP